MQNNQSSNQSSIDVLISRLLKTVDTGTTHISVIATNGTRINIQ